MRSLWDDDAQALTARDVPPPRPAVTVIEGETHPAGRTPQPPVRPGDDGDRTMGVREESHEPRADSVPIALGAWQGGSEPRFLVAGAPRSPAAGAVLENPRIVIHIVSKPCRIPPREPGATQTLADLLLAFLGVHSVKLGACFDR